MISKVDGANVTQLSGYDSGSDKFENSKFRSVHGESYVGPLNVTF